MSTTPGVTHLCATRAHADLALLACAHAMDPQDRCIVVDDRQGLRRAQALGLPIHAHLPPPLRRPWLARRALRTLLIESRRDHHPIIAWGAHLEPLLSATRGPQILIDFDRGIIERFPGSLRSPGPIRTLPAPQTPLGPLSTMPDRASRAACRERLSLAPHERAIALAGARHSECDVPAFVHVLGMLHFADVPVVGIVDRARMSRHRAAMRRVREAMPHLRVLVRDEPMFHWIAACDAAVLAPGDRFTTAETRLRFDASLLARSIAAAGVPIIVDERDASDTHNPRIVKAESAHPAAMARALRIALDALASPSDAPAPLAPSGPSSARLAWRDALDTIADPTADAARPGALDGASA